MSELAAVWKEVASYIEDNISVIPVRDKDEVTDGKTFVKKSAYFKWKQYQERRASKDELWKQLEQKNTTAVAIVCGPISGNLEVIDIDVKFQADSGIKYFAAVKDFDSRLFDILRIHKTPSGGYHVIYRIENPPIELPGNVKLAGRMATEAELIETPKQKTKNFLETRANGGYVLAPPSLGYMVYKNNPIPVLSWEQREILINIAKTFDTVVKETAPVYKSTAKEESYYDETPWEHFNRTCDPVELMVNNGWKQEFTKNNNNIYFTRPGKESGISMSFRHDIRKFYCFTSNSEFDPNTAYNPISVILKLQFNEDKKSLYAYLVNNGYGKVKYKVEQSLAQTLARKNRPLPKNFSEDAVKIHEQTKEQLTEAYPYGQFIKWDADEEKQAVSREALIWVANNLGFRYFDGECVRIVDNFIDTVTERQFQDALKDYINEEDADIREELCNIYEAFMQKNGNYTMSRLQLLDASLIMRDSKDICYKYYKNGYLIITAESIEFTNYEDSDLLIWKHSIQNRNYVKGESGVYRDFIKRAVQYPDAAKLVMGYLSHEYKDETTGYIIVLTEVCPDPKQGGGSGKNVFCNLLKLTTTYTSKPGAQSKFDEKFFQSWNRQRVFGISDVDKNFDFMFLKEPSTGVFIWKKLFKDEVEIPVEDGPKFIVQTNYSYEVSDGGLRRRIIPLEFTQFFTAQGGLDVYYGKHFPDQWDDGDYAGFDTYIAESVQEWLKSGRKLKAMELTDTGKTKQWEQTYKSACGFILTYWDVWLSSKDGVVFNETFKHHLDTYMSENNISKTFMPSSSKINDAIEEYANMKNVWFSKDKTVKDDAGTPRKARIFEKDPFIPEK